MSRKEGCPRCGHLNVHAVNINNGWIIRCTHCNLQSNNYKTLHYAIKNWDELAESIREEKEIRLIDANSLITRLREDSPDPQGVDDWISEIRKEPTVDLLDKIRAEIESQMSSNGFFNDGIGRALQIIDKYREGEKE